MLFITSSIEAAVFNTVFSNGIGFQLNTSSVAETSPLKVFPMNAFIPFRSALKLANNFSKKLGASLVLTLSYQLSFKI